MARKKNIKAQLKVPASSKTSSRKKMAQNVEKRPKR
jgi:hypothetical protein